jgi:hypothetical protein
MAGNISCMHLLELCLQCQATFPGQRMTLATHVDQFTSGSAELAADEAAASTLREIIYGCSRSKKLLAVTVDGLYAKHAGQIARSDRGLFELFTLLAVYKLQELGLAEFRLFVLSQEAHRMHTLLSFLWSPDMQAGWLKEQWSTVLDHIFVEEKLLGDMRAVAPQMNALISELHATIAHASAVSSGATPSNELGVGVVKVAPKQSTIPEPFHLTQPAVRMLMAPTLQMDAVYKASPLPEPTPSLADLEAHALSRRRAAADATRTKHMQAKAPKLSTDARSTVVHTASEKLRLELEAKEREATIGVTLRDPPKIKPVPAAKGTVATILREDLLYKRRQEEKAAELAKFESELRDEEAFFEWQRKMEAEDDEKAAAEVLARKEASRQSAVDAVKAMAQAAQEKHLQVLEIREDLRVINKEKERAAEKEREKKKLQAEKIAKDKELIPLAVQEVVQSKVKKAEVIAAMKIEAEKVKKAEKKVELAKKKQLIKEIQAMEKLAAVRAKRPKIIDPTTTGGLGLLDEMSIVELQARLTGLAEREEALLKEKRRKILDEKSSKLQVLEEMQRQSQRMRGEIRQEFVEKKKERLTQTQVVLQQEKERQAQSAALLAAHLNAQSDVKRAEALRLVKELREKKIEREFFLAAKAGLAEEREEDMRRAAERRELESKTSAATTEKQRQIEAYTAEKNRKKVEREREREKVRVRRAADAKLKEMRKDDIDFDLEDKALKAINHSEINTAVRSQIVVHRSANPYAFKIAEREARRAAALATVTRVASARAGGAAAAKKDRDDDEFRASERMAEEDVRRQIAALAMADDHDEAEEKTQPVLTTTAPAGRASPAQDALAKSAAKLASITQKQGTTMKAPAAKSTTTKVPLAARA